MSEAYATAVVVGREPPVSSHLGDRAIVYADGRMEGFVGGSCSRDIVRAQALEAIRLGEPRLVRITSHDAPGDSRDVITIPMHCVSEGSVEVYIEPQVAKPALIVTGWTPVARALAAIAPTLGFTVAHFVGSDEGGVEMMTLDVLAGYLEAMEPRDRIRSAVVIASQGHYDDTALATILRHDFGYVGMVASRNRAAEIFSDLQGEGLIAERLNTVHCPAGIAIGARKASDVAVSIFAEIVACNAQRANASAEDAFASIS